MAEEYRIIKITTNTGGGITDSAREDISSTAVTFIVSGLTISKDLNVSGQIIGDGSGITNLDSNTGLTNSFVSKTGDTINGSLSAVTISANTFNGDGSNLTNIPHSGLTDIGNRTHAELDSFWNFTLGSMNETPEINVTSSGGTVYLNLEKSGGGDLTLLFSGGSYIFDSTPIASVALTVGSDTSPQENFVYIPEDTKVLTTSTVSFPTIGYVPVATTIIQSASGVANDGAYKLHAWVDHIALEGDNGQLNHLSGWIRAQHATWISGVDLTPTITTNGGSLDDFDVATTAGTVRQLHEHNFQARDTSETGATGHILVINDPTTPYVKYDDLNLIIQDSEGTSLRSNRDRYNLVVWGIANEGDNHLVVNLPAGKYTGGGGGNDSAAIFDDEKTANYTIPDAYVGVGFLIARLTVKYTSADSGTLEILQTEDLRGQLPTIVAGGTVHEITEFPDNNFRLFDQDDSTKKIAFEVSGITTSTVRTYIGPDVDGTLITSGNLSDINLSDLGSTSAPSLSATTFSADTIFSGSTDLYDIFTTSGGSSRIASATTTTNASATTIQTITNITDDTLNIIEVYAKAYVSGGGEWGTWKRTLVVPKTSGTPTIELENSDVDKTSANLGAVSVDFVISGGNIEIQATGITATTVNWETAYEVIL